MSEIIYEAKFSEKKDIPEKPDFSLYDAETQEFINSSIAYAEKSKSDIVISKDMYDIRSVIYVTIGMFFGGFKKAFLHFAMKSKDFLILPMNGHSNFTLKISATYNMVCKNSPMIKRVVVAGSRSFTDYEQAKKLQTDIQIKSEKSIPSFLFQDAAAELIHLEKDTQEKTAFIQSVVPPNGINTVMRQDRGETSKWQKSATM